MPILEQDTAMDDMCEWGAAHNKEYDMKQERICCDGLCEQGRACPVTQFQARNDLHRHFAPGVIEHHRAQMTSADRVLLALIWFASIAISSAFLGWGFEVLSGLDWAHVLQMIWVAR